MNKKILLSILIILLAASAIWLMMRSPAEAPMQIISLEEKGGQSIGDSGTYTLNVTESTLKARGQKPLVPGYTDVSVVNFKEGTVVVENGKLTGIFTLDMSSIMVETTGKGGGESMLAKHLKSADFFDVEKNPTSLFIIKSSEKSGGENLYDITGDLTLKGITKPLTFPAMIYMQDGKLTAEGTINLDRTQWDIKYGSGTFFEDIGDRAIGDIFNIEFKISADAQ
jgi:polyisoprenoid-binding protein YceI